MTISTRTPEGEPHLCPVCRKAASLEPCWPGGDSVCPSCGQLLWRFRNAIGVNLGISLDELALDSVDELAADSLDVVELVMQLEDEFQITIADEDYDQIKTLRDAVRYILRRREEQG